jgi:hypothetical protein
MIIPQLHRQPVPLDREAHRALRVKPLDDWGVAGRMNSVFVSVMEFVEACREYPIVFVRAGTGPNGAPEVAPVAVFGLSAEENLFLDGPRWRGHYVPAVLRLYPFAIGRIDAQSFAICIDTAWPGLSTSEGTPLFDDKGELTDFAKGILAQMETYEGEVQRTRQVCEQLMAHGLLRDMRFDVNTPDGKNFAVEGFLTVDEDKYRALPDAAVLELHRSGALALLNSHMVSLRNMRRLAEWKVQRLSNGQAAQPA